MKFEFVKSKDLKNHKLNSLIIWTNRDLNYFDNEVIELIKNEDEFLYKQLRDKKTLEENNVLFCAGIENKIDSYILNNILYKNISEEKFNKSLININKVINYIDILNIRVLGIITPKIKLSNLSNKNFYLIWKNIIENIKLNKKVKKVLIIEDDENKIKQLKRLIFLSKIPFINKLL